MASSNYFSLVIAMIASLLFSIGHSQSSTATRNLLSEGEITASSPNDTQCCVATNCSNGIPSCAVDDNSTTVWTLKTGTLKAHIFIQLKSSSLVSDITVMLSQSSVIPSSIVVTASGTNITWTTYFNDTCQPNDEYLRRRDSQYYSCKGSGQQQLLTVYIPEGLFSIRNVSSPDGWLWWKTFNRFELIIEANAGDYNNTTTSGSIEIADIELNGWDEPMTTSCNCHPVGVTDVEKPCPDGKCICRGTSTSNSQCIPDANNAVPTYGPVSGGTLSFTTGDFLANATNVTLGDNYECKILRNNDTLLQVKTSAGIESDPRSSTPARIYWERPQGVVSLNVANWEFTFKPDPIIDSVYPMTSIISGGIPLTVTGKNLDSVAYPFITLVIEVFGSEPHFANFTNSGTEPNDKFCHHINSTTMECITPDTDNYPENQDEKATLTISMDINKYNDYKKCEFDNNDCDFDRTENPDVYDWGDNMIYNVYDGKRSFLVNGQMFLVGSTEQDYRVTVGGVQCEIISIITNLISFYPPDPSNFTSVNDAKSTILYVGYYSYTVGKIQYYLSWIDNPTNRNALIIGLVCGIGGLIILILIIVLCRTHYKSKKTPLAESRSPTVHYRPPEIRYTTAPQRDPTILDHMNPEQRIKVEETLVPFNRLQFEEEIGSGNFGKVYRGLFFKTDDDLQEVAIKTILNESMVESHEKVSFLQEAMIMKDFSHPNVLSLIAVAIENDFPYVVLPLMENGDLRGFVTKPDKLMSVLDLTSYSLQVAEGMAYLAENKFVHRDLAARNCMINKEFVVKVADFGLARDIFEHDYYRTSDNNRPLPVKWMAIECLTGVAKFTESSDVWSFGVLMWELFTRGRRPYADVDNTDIKRFLLSGERLEKPRHTPEFIYALMKSCWEETQTKRPRFKELVATLQEIVFQATDNHRASMTSASSDDETADPNQVGLHIQRRHPVSYLDLRRNVPSAYFEQPQDDVGSDPRLSKFDQDLDLKVTQDGAWSNPRLSKFGQDSDHKVTQDVARSSQQLTQAIPGSHFEQMKDDTDSDSNHMQDDTGSTKLQKQDVRDSDDDTGPDQQRKQDDRNSNFKQRQDETGPNQKQKQDDRDSDDDAGPSQQRKQDDRNSYFKQNQDDAGSNHNQKQDESRSSQQLSQNDMVTKRDTLRYFAEDLV